MLGHVHVSGPALRSVCAAGWGSSVAGSAMSYQAGGVAKQTVGEEGRAVVSACR